VVSFSDVACWAVADESTAADRRTKTAQQDVDSVMILFIVLAGWLGIGESYAAAIAPFPFR
jgi:hypothetical protein